MAAGQKVNPCHECGFTPRRRKYRARYAVRSVTVPTPIEVVHLLAQRPELRPSFPVADEVDTWVRWSA